MAVKALTDDTLVGVGALGQYQGSDVIKTKNKMSPLKYTEGSFRIWFWRARQDSNPQPLGPKPSALSVELQAQRDGNNPCIGASDGIRTRDLLCHRQAP